VPISYNCRNEKNRGLLNNLKNDGTHQLFARAMGIPSGGQEGGTCPSPAPWKKVCGRP